jgi:pyruvate dehydrogenase E1 component
MADWIAAGTSYSTHGVQMIPVYVCYSMFGMQRTMDLVWAAGDQRARGFLIGGTSGRTTLNGEGLQHEDGHSQILAGAVPNCIAYDPTFAYEVAVIVQDGLRRMVHRAGRRLLLPHGDERELRAPGDAGGRGAGHPQGHVPVPQGRGRQRTARAAAGLGHHLHGSHRRRRAAEEGLGRRSRPLVLPQLQRTGARRQRLRALEPAAPDRKAARGARRAVPAETRGPVIAATDYVRVFAEQIRALVPRRYTVLGTDGFGRSDTREKLRHFFEVDRYWITLAALKALADEGQLKKAKVAEAIAKYGLDPNKPNPVKV